MSDVTMVFREYWEQRKLIPKGVWLMLIAYSLVAFGSPMPAKITWLEIVMGCGLLMGGILLTGLVIRKVQQEKSAQWCFGLTVLLFLIPLCVGLLRGNVLSDITRDIFPLTFQMIVPILLIYAASTSSRAVLSALMAIALVFVGVCTAVTFFLGTLNLVGSTDKMVSMIRGGFAQIESSQTVQTEQTAQTAQTAQADREKFNENIRIVFLKIYDPSMLFAAIFLSSWGVILIVKSWLWWLPGIILLGGGALISYGFMILGLRSYTALFVLAVITICLFKWRERGVYVRLLPLVLVSGIILWPQIDAIFQLLWAKQHSLGTNGKAGEWLAVLTTIVAAPQTMLLGIGWGGTFANPILLGVPSRFTHSMLSFYLLKSGVIGVSMLFAVVGLLLIRSKKITKTTHFDILSLILLISCLPPLLIGVLFEPTYKMLSYGVILALFVLVLPSFGKRAR